MATPTLNTTHATPRPESHWRDWKTSAGEPRTSRTPEKPRQSLDIVIVGLSITSSWGNGHATTYRGLVRELSRRGHKLLFLERNAPWYADNRDLPRPPYGRTELYDS